MSNIINLNIPELLDENDFNSVSDLVGGNNTTNLFGDDNTTDLFGDNNTTDSYPFFSTTSEDNNLVEIHKKLEMKYNLLKRKEELLEQKEKELLALNTKVEEPKNITLMNVIDYIVDLIN